MIIDNGSQCTISGSGQIFEKFEQTGVIEGYTGCGMRPVKFSHPDADAAVIRSMSFDETYHGMNYKCTRSKYVFHAFLSQFTEIIT